MKYRTVNVPEEIFYDLLERAKILGVRPGLLAREILARGFSGEWSLEACRQKNRKVVGCNCPTCMEEP